MGKFKKTSDTAASKSDDVSASSVLEDLANLGSDTGACEALIAKLEKSEIDADIFANFFETHSEEAERIVTTSPLLLIVLSKTRAARSPDVRFSFVKCLRNAVAWVNDSVIESLLDSNKMVEFVASTMVQDLSNTTLPGRLTIAESHFQLIAELRERHPAASDIIKAQYLSHIAAVAAHPTLPDSLKIAACTAILDLPAPQTPYPGPNSNPELDVHLRAVFALPLDTSLHQLSAVNFHLELRKIAEAVAGTKVTDDDKPSEKDAAILKQSESALESLDRHARSAVFILRRFSESTGVDEDEDQLDELPFKLARRNFQVSQLMMESLLALAKQASEMTDPALMEEMHGWALPPKIWATHSLLRDLSLASLASCGLLLRLPSLPTLLASQITAYAIRTLADQVGAGLIEDVDAIARLLIAASVLGALTFEQLQTCAGLMVKIFQAEGATLETESVQVIAVTFLRSLPMQMLRSQESALTTLSLIAHRFLPQVTASLVDLMFDVFSEDDLDSALVPELLVRTKSCLVRAAGEETEDERAQRLRDTAVNLQAFIEYKRL